MCELTSWSRDLTVEIGGRDVINHAGTAALRMLADRTGLTAGLSRALPARTSSRCTTGAGCWPMLRC